MKPLLSLILLGLLGLLATGPVLAQSASWRDSSGAAVAETESMKSSNGFAGAVFATTDEDWARKWNTPPETVPAFVKAGKVPYGKKVSILTFFSNPKLDQQGNANLRCHFRILSPTGAVAMEQRDMTCYAGKIEGSLYRQYLSGPVLTFSGDPGDPPGSWTVEVLLRDEQRNVELPLRTSFELR